MAVELPPPLVFSVPEPVKLRVMFVPEIPPVPVRELNVPVQPAYEPVPPVIVAEPVAEPDPLSIELGIVNLPLREPPEKVMVKGATRFPFESTDVNESVAVN